MPYKLIASWRARRQMRSIDEWWRINRPAATDLFAEELQQAVDRIAAFPESGTLYRSEEPVVRYTLLPGTRYCVYYHIEEAAKRVRVVAVRSGRRGSKPRL